MALLGSAPRGRRGGFSLIEILVALVIVGILTALLGQIMESLMQGSTDLRARFRHADDTSAIRRLLHRDVQSLRILDLEECDKDTLALSTTHDLLQDEAFPVSVVWETAHGRLVRIERNKDINYINSIDLGRDVAAFKLELLSAREDRWQRVDHFGGQTAQTAHITALRITIGFKDSQSVVVVERLPYAITAYSDAH
ncbi:MAG: type II secretion system protein [Desulfovibrionaceae bacterium]|jgi:prepilin-type N-terminal cleavage/methylation domain-containing protein|nr:type II secretion system protein [Desulfovibrionaceae bacterium]